jgi:hypothetical protein
MCVIEFKSLVSRVGVLVVVSGLLLSARTATAQYTAQVLLPPADLPTSATTRAVAINSAGQVFGEALGDAFHREPVLWTGGVPQHLPIPTGYNWDDLPGEQFLNDNGTVVAKVLIPNGVSPGVDAARVIVWQNGDPQIAPLPPIACSYGAYFPLGLNSAGHVLIGAALRTDTSTNTCTNLWIWDGSTGFQDAPALNVGGPLVCSPIYSIQLAHSHLNDADHVALDFGPSDDPDPRLVAPPQSQPGSWSARHLHL